MIIMQTLSILPIFRRIIISLLFSSIYSQFGQPCLWPINWQYCHEFRVTIDGVWISNRIYGTHTERNYNNDDSLTELHTPKIIVIAVAR
jgi:hypothetical protein